MPKTREVTVYEYDELSDKAKAKARDWYREGHSDFGAEATIEDAVRIAALLGWEVTERSVKTVGGQTRTEPNVFWSLGYVQSDYARFDARLSYRKGCVKAVTEYAPKDETLHRIARDWAAAQKAVGYKAEGTVKDHHYYGAQFEWSHAETGESFDAETEKALSEPVRDFFQWIYDALRAEYEYQTEDAQVEEGIRANEYDFTADGKRYRY